MGGFGYGRLGGLAVIAAVAAMSKLGISPNRTNYLPVEAEIFRIDRTCNFVVVSGPTKGTHETGKCDETPDFERVRDDPANPKRLTGSAEINLSYSSPTDGSRQTGTLKFDGQDAEFYSWKAHDTVKILVDKTDPTKIERF